LKSSAGRPRRKRDEKKGRLSIGLFNRLPRRAREKGGCEVEREGSLALEERRDKTVKKEKGRSIHGKEP